MKTSYLFCPSVVLSLLVGAPTAAWAGDFYVSTSGNDSGSGDTSSPWRTPQKALDAAGAAGGAQTVHFAEGTYEVSEALRVPELVSIEGAGRDKSIIAALVDSFGEWNTTPLLLLKSTKEAVPAVSISNTWGDSVGVDNQHEAVDGNQFVRAIGFDGRRTQNGDGTYVNRGAFSCMTVENRNRVTIEDVHCTHSYKYGLLLYSSWRATMRDVEIRNVLVEEAAGEEGSSAYGNIAARGTFQNLAIHHSQIKHFEQSGYGVKIDKSYTGGDGFVDVQHGLKLHHMDIQGRPNSSFNNNYSPNFSAELVVIGYDGVEIYGNRFENQLSLPENFPVELTGRFSVNVHHNHFAIRRGPPIELGPSHAIVEYNLFETQTNQGNDLWNVIGEYNAGNPIEDVWVRRNVFVGFGGSMFVHYTAIKDFRFVNNALTGSVGRLFEARANGNPDTVLAANNVLMGSGGNLAFSAADDPAPISSTPRVADVRGNRWFGYAQVEGIDPATNPSGAPDWIGTGIDIGNYGPTSASSNLADQGVDVGLPFLGSAPDVGPLEFGEAPFLVGLSYEAPPATDTPDSGATSSGGTGLGGTGPGSREGTKPEGMEGTAASASANAAPASEGGCSVSLPARKENWVGTVLAALVALAAVARRRTRS